MQLQEGTAQEGTARDRAVLRRVVQAVRPADPAAAAAACALQSRLTKPPGSLGELEDLAVRLAGFTGVSPPPLPEPAALAIFAGDHGVHAEGVTPWPQAVTGQMVANFLAGGAVVNAFARQAGVPVTVVDVGVGAPLTPVDGLLIRRVRSGSRNLAVEAALTEDEAHRALAVGVEVADLLIDGGAAVLLTGDMGIANTTPAAALIAAFTGADAAAVTGRGAGIDDETYQRKVTVVRAALDRPRPADPVGVLASLGGYEHAALAGYILGALARRVPVILDGVIAVSAALVAAALAPDAPAGMVAGHRSAEPGATVALTSLGLTPLLDLRLRLGEGTGAVLALPVVASAVRVLHEVATFDAAGVAQR
ncbi:MAG TPA: nicotinate-nucleotide--dimethylbenzimidazole phosphoribosyltransferase [Micromonosporaceae bacterium]|nr:nicotinate-nucleotide--dimethylbenzimidazole phosphoribosyltransferase [Micromonosporaceae bacterium]